MSTLEQSIAHEQAGGGQARRQAGTQAGALIAGKFNTDGDRKLKIA